VGLRLVEEEVGAERARLVAAGVADGLRRLDLPATRALAAEEGGGGAEAHEEGRLAAAGWRDGGAAGWRWLDDAMAAVRGGGCHEGVGMAR
jgi:hypothetical protein